MTLSGMMLVHVTTEAETPFSHRNGVVECRLFINQRGLREQLWDAIRSGGQRDWLAYIGRAIHCTMPKTRVVCWQERLFMELACTCGLPSKQCSIIRPGQLLALQAIMHTYRPLLPL